MIVRDGRCVNVYKNFFVFVNSVLSEKILHRTNVCFSEHEYFKAELAKL